MATADAEVEEVNPVGEKEDEVEPEVIEYPLRVDYCGLCSMPAEVNIILPSQGGLL